jgi:hypothetical protein
MKVWKTFAGSRRVRIICFALVGALLLASVLGLSLSGAAPMEETGASYQHAGQFDYSVYLNPSILYGDVTLGGGQQGQQVPMVFFRDIVRDVQLTFSYRFSSSQSLTNVVNDVVVSIIAQNPGVWSKEIPQLEETYSGAAFKIEFPLDLDYLERVVDNIEADIGITSSAGNFIVRAAVHTTSETALGETIEDDFTYELTAVLSAKKLELKGDLGSTNEAYNEGIKCTGTGRFDYEVTLLPNKLYDTTVLKSDVSATDTPSSPQVVLGPGLVYFPDIIDRIAGRFSYHLLCDRPVSEQSEEVQVTAIVQNPGQWSKELVVVPAASEVGSFIMSFPIDIEYYTTVIDAIGEETGTRGSSYTITIKASVHTSALTDVGAINDTYSQTLAVNLESNTLTFGKELSGSKSGSIDGAETSDAPEAASRTPWIIGLVIALLALGYFGWSQAQLRVAPVSAGEAEAARARKKYRQMMVEVGELPEIKPSETVVPLNSVDDLMRIADDLAKPVLHQEAEGTHTYCVIDSGARYLYQIKT